MVASVGTLVVLSVLLTTGAISLFGGSSQTSETASPPNTQTGKNGGQRTPGEPLDPAGPNRSTPQAEGRTNENQPENGLPTPPKDETYVDATLDVNQFVLSGQVPSEKAKTAISQAAEVAYSPFVTNKLEVKPDLDEPAWLARTPDTIGLLPMITDGTIRLQDDVVHVVGRSPNPEYAQIFRGALTTVSGLAIDTDLITITNLDPPVFDVLVDNGAATLSGSVPSQAIIELLSEGAIAAYGEDKVKVDLQVDDSTYTSFWMFTMPGVFQLFQPFPNYRIHVENGVTTGTLQGGVNFDYNSVEISEETAQVLNIGVAILSRDRSLAMTVEGHTDSKGEERYNLDLSLARAKSVIEYLARAGVDRNRLKPVAKGESEPVSNNDTAEGRAANRRVNFEFGQALP